MSSVGFCVVSIDLARYLADQDRMEREEQAANDALIERLDGMYQQIKTLIEDSDRRDSREYKAAVFEFESGLEFSLEELTNLAPGGA